MGRVPATLRRDRLEVRLAFLGLLASLSLRAADPAPLLTRAHAHNDYEHKRPLLDALDQGFCSVEADVFLVKGSLWVAHSELGLRPERQLTNLYLDPLLARVRERGGSVYATKAPFYLLIDVKTDGPGVYANLQALLPRYREMFTHFHDGKAEPGPITVVLSGDRPAALVAADPDRYCAVDGKLPDLEANGGATPASTVPWISEDWSGLFRWRGVGPIPPADHARLVELVTKAHAQGRQIRFWGSPDREAIWAEEDKAGVDWINTDRLADLRRYFLAKPSGQK